MSVSPDYIVFRSDRHPAIDGRWWDRSASGSPTRFACVPTALRGRVQFVATGEFEVRDDGIVAQVYRECEREWQQRG